MAQLVGADPCVLFVCRFPLFFYIYFAFSKVKVGDLKTFRRFVGRLPEKGTHGLFTGKVSLKY